MGTFETPYDADLLLEDGGSAITSSAAGSGGIIDLGGPGRVNGVVVADVSAIDFATGDETYELMIQFSDDASFTGDAKHTLSLPLGDARDGMANNKETGRRFIPFMNESNDDDVADTLVSYRYMRLYVAVAGTTPSITLKAYASIL